jgi:hypothetical protein
MQNKANQRSSVRGGPEAQYLDANRSTRDESSRALLSGREPLVSMEWIRRRMDRRGLLGGREPMLSMEWIRRRTDRSLRRRFRRSATWMEGSRCRRWSGSGAELTGACAVDSGDPQPRQRDREGCGKGRQMVGGAGIPTRPGRWDGARWRLNWQDDGEK